MKSPKTTLNKIIFFMCAAIAATGMKIGFANAGVTPVAQVDLNRYSGVWYEIASIRTKYTKDCVCSKAQFSLRGDGSVALENSCRERVVNGKISSITGKGRVEDPRTNSTIQVTYMGVHRTDYWIIGLDANYQHAVVSDRAGGSLSIISRTPELSAVYYHEALSIATANGIDTSRLQMTLQAGCQ